MNKQKVYNIEKAKFDQQFLLFEEIEKVSKTNFINNSKDKRKIELPFDFTLFEAT